MPGNSQTHLDDVYAAIADPTRRAILRRLADGEARVTAIAQPFRMTLHAVSKHIRILEQAKLIRRRRIGREHILSINPSALDDAASWIDAQRALWTRRIDTLESLLRAEDEQRKDTATRKSPR
jgi:DNA-binding transcriptional ArsR family regulator